MRLFFKYNSDVSRRVVSCVSLWLPCGCNRVGDGSSTREVKVLYPRVPRHDGRKPILHVTSLCANCWRCGMFPNIYVAAFHRALLLPLIIYSGAT